MFTGSVMAMPVSMNQELSRGEFTGSSGMVMIRKREH
jgi:hypothetical protein